MAAPTITSAGTRNGRFGANAGARSESESTSAAVPTTRLLPKRENQHTDQRHGDERPDRSTQQGDAEQCLAQVQLLFYGRYPDDPGPYYEAVDEEHGEHVEPGRAQRRLKVRRCAVHRVIRRVTVVGAVREPCS
ncbi:MAG TPA: hypothetical protein VIZ60_16145 [Rubrobacter sp.]